jgi:hypothetical protein
MIIDYISLSDAGGIMSRYKIENPREQVEEPQYSRWQLFQEWFWEFIFYGRAPRQTKKPRWRTKKSVHALYGAFIKGSLASCDLYDQLHESQVEEFINLHRQTKAALNGEEGAQIAPELIVVLTQTFVTDHRRLVFATMQVDNILENLELEVQKRSRNANVVRRED